MANLIATFGVMLGPYRNLTTLTAATLALHPSVQVMNHGLDRLTSRPECNFFQNPDDKVLENFLSEALHESEAGTRGDFGGSITLSHAYDHSAMRNAHEARYGKQLVKTHPRCLLLKDSARFQNRIMRLQDLSAFLKQFERMQFMLPIRDPLDCAASNMKTGKLEFLGAPRHSSLDEALNAVLSYLGWALDLADSFPTRVLWFTERDSRPLMFNRWADFLRIESDQRWIRDAESVYRISPRVHDSEIRKAADVRIRTKLAAWPAVIDSLGL